MVRFSICNSYKFVRNVFPSVMPVFFISVAVYKTLCGDAKQIFWPVRLTAMFPNVTPAFTLHVKTLRFFSEKARFNECRTDAKGYVH